MADFFQNGSITTFHRLGSQSLDLLEQKLYTYSRDNPIALVLPCHADELHTPALHHILDTLKTVPYLKEIVVGIDQATEEQYEYAKTLFQGLPQKPTLLWINSPDFQNQLLQLKEISVQAVSSGKGLNLWTCFGYVLGSNQAKIVVAHDCDISTYNREMLARLCYPVVNRSFGFDFCKGYCARFTNKLNGRVMRLLMTPLLRSLHQLLGSHPFLSYLESFRYPLAGEISLTVDTLRRTAIPSHWGVEIGMLAEIYPITAAQNICQVDIAERFDHKHQDLSASDRTRGLHKMAIDIVKSLLHYLCNQGIKLDPTLLDAIIGHYTQQAKGLIRAYSADADLNGFNYNHEEEGLIVATFCRSLQEASEEYFKNPLVHPVLPSWNEMQRESPGFLEQLRS